MTSETQNPVEAVARAICLVHGQDPDEFAPLTEICTAENQPELWWRFYEEDAQAALAALPVPKASVGRERVLEILHQLTESPASGSVVWTAEKHAARDRQIEYAAAAILAPPAPEGER